MKRWSSNLKRDDGGMKANRQWLSFGSRVNSALSSKHPVSKIIKGLLRLTFWASTPSRLASRFRTIRTVSRSHSLDILKSTLGIIFEIDIFQPQPPSASSKFSHRSYQDWVSKYDTLDETDRTLIGFHLEKLDFKPVISVIVPVYNTPATTLTETLNSVIDQIYPHWQLCIADDCSSADYILPLLKRYSESDGRIKIIQRETNGRIAHASNSALSIAEGEYVAFLDHDDLLSPRALYEVVAELNRYRDADILYSDEDKIDESGIRFDPYFKPDFSPDLLFGQNMINHLCIIRKALLDELGGFRTGFEGSQDYDLVLRAFARSTLERVRHIPSVLYHWRQTSQGGSFSQEHLEECVGSAGRAIEDVVNGGRDRSVGDVVRISDALPWHRLERRIDGPEPLVSIIIPTRDRVELLQTCMAGVLDRTGYGRFEVIIVDNESVEAATFEYFRSITNDVRVRICSVQGPFNYSALNNTAAREAKGDILLLLNNDIDVITAGWLHEMVSTLLQPGVGIVGAKLLFADGRVQHAGVRLGAGTFDGGPGVAGHLGLFQDRDDPGYFGSLMLKRDVSAVTGACLAIHRSLYLEVGGLDEQNLKVAFNDIDLCLKVRAAGLRVLWTPFAELYHLESASRGADTHPEKIARFHAECRHMLDRWGSELRNDPFYNPAFDNFASDYCLAFPPRNTKPWARA